jgi:hypothetical protein
VCLLFVFVCLFVFDAFCFLSCVPHPTHTPHYIHLIITFTSPTHASYFVFCAREEKKGAKTAQQKQKQSLCVGAYVLFVRQNKGCVTHFVRRKLFDSRIVWWMKNRGHVLCSPQNLFCRGQKLVLPSVYFLSCTRRPCEMGRREEVCMCRKELWLCDNVSMPSTQNTNIHTAHPPSPPSSPSPLLPNHPHTHTRTHTHTQTHSPPPTHYNFCTKMPRCAVFDVLCGIVPFHLCISRIS